MASEQGYLIGQLSALIDGDNSKCAATARLPIDREEFGVGLQGWKRSARDTGESSGRRVRDKDPRTGIGSGVYLYEVGIPGIAADVEVVVAKLLARGFPEDVSCSLRTWSVELSPSVPSVRQARDILKP